MLYEDVPSDQNLPLLEHENIQFYRADIRDYHDVRSATRGVDRVVHAAGQTSVPTSIERTIEDFWINAGGTVNVLQAAREEGEERGENL
ncbi:MAG: NAD-dependent epimerase/dehydratase family protein, partial [Thermoplasmata archaeon]|nr:NAD-dependent epimerase/dehydratase family protein [Thermoplasmata archaeon]